MYASCFLYFYNWHNFSKTVQHLSQLYHNVPSEGLEIYHSFTNKQRSYLIVVDFFPLHNPDTGQLLENVESCERPQIVDEDVGNPEVIEKLQVDGSPLALGHRVVRGQAGLLPTDGEVHRQSHAELFVVDLQSIFTIV